MNSLKTNDCNFQKTGTEGLSMKAPGKSGETPGTPGVESWVETRKLEKKWDVLDKNPLKDFFLGRFLLAHEVTRPRMTHLIIHIKGRFSPPSSPVIKKWWTHHFLAWTQTHFHVPVLEMERCGWWNLLNLLFMWVCQLTLVMLWSTRLFRGERKFHKKIWRRCLKLLETSRWRNVLFLFSQMLLETSKQRVCAKSSFDLNQFSQGL